MKDELRKIHNFIRRHNKNYGWEELLKMIPDGDCLERDHLAVIRAKYRYYEKHKYELENENN